ncbi:MAG: response regulator [Gammaproteobacteria bacterium]|nr:response regulator [Gammaproteobacteria bacterium]
MEKLLPVCYFPSTAMFVDDRQHFLTGLALSLPRQLNYEMYTDPLKALNLLQGQKSVLTLHEALSSLSEQPELEFDEKHAHSTVEVDISRIYQTIYVNDRFKEVSVVVIDYAMPEMNGLEFCRELEGLPIKKLMMTGEASDDLAVSAFNEGVIDQFIRKRDPDFSNSLHQKIDDLQHAYFQDLSHPIMANLLAKKGSCLNNARYMELFHQVCMDRDIKEYYLVNEKGSYLMLNFEGRFSAFIIEDEPSVQGYEHIAVDNDAPADVQQALKARRKIPFFLGETEMDQPVEKWNHYLHAASTFESEGKKYYYAVIENLSDYDIKFDEVVSYRRYLDSM